VEIELEGKILKSLSRIRNLNSHGLEKGVTEYALWFRGAI